MRVDPRDARDNQRVDAVVMPGTLPVSASGGPMLDILVTQRVLPGKEEAFEALIRKMEENTVNLDAGCLRYEWYRAEEPHTYILIERWITQEAVQAHLQGGPSCRRYAEVSRACARAVQSDASVEDRRAWPYVMA
jgi:quinol monooxygenase YgiN